MIDSGHFTGWPAMFLDVADPRAWLFVNGFQAVGLGLGAAIGAAVARPDRITVAALGDGGLFLALQELDTAARIGARLLIVVYDDAAYGAEVHHFGPMGHDTSTVRHADADLAAIARGAGVERLRCARPTTSARSATGYTTATARCSSTPRSTRPLRGLADRRFPHELTTTTRSSPCRPSPPQPPCSPGSPTDRCASST